MLYVVCGSYTTTVQKALIALTTTVAPKIVGRMNVHGTVFDPSYKIE